MTVYRRKNMEKNENVFEYTYSAPQCDEVKKIREKYLPREESKLEHLRRLDESAGKKGLACSLLLGIFSSLVLGIGMCCTMVWGDILMIPGIIIGSAGLLGVSLAYPLNLHLIQKERQRLAPEILKLTEELMNGQA